jgi:hypothetical protein
MSAFFLKSIHYNVVKNENDIFLSSEHYNVTTNKKAVVTMPERIIRVELEILKRCKWYGADVSQIILHRADMLRAVAISMIVDGLQISDAVREILN